MADAPILGGSAKLQLDGAIFSERLNRTLIHDSVRAELNARRRGTASTKTRGLVSGGGAKPWRQKGTGRARAGSVRSPLWTGGGTTFGPQPRSYTFKVNRKERRAALRSALSVHAERDSLAGVDPANFPQPSTKQAAKLLKDWGSISSVLLIVGADQQTLALSFRNIDRVNVLAASEAGVADIVNAARLLISQVGLDELSGRLSAERTGEAA